MREVAFDEVVVSLREIGRLMADVPNLRAALKMMMTVLWEKENVLV